MTAAEHDALGHAVIRKVIWRLCPFLGLLYLIAYIDRNNAGFAKLEMTEALNMSETAFGFAAGIFFIGYVLFEVPSNLMLDRFGARRWIARIMVTWGVVAVGTAFVTDAVQFTIARFILGVAEAGFFPGVLLYLTFWFPRQYRTTALAVFAVSNPLANAIGAPLSGWILTLDGIFGLDGWQLVFVLEGIPAILLAGATLYLLPARPEDARWLTADEATWITTTIEAEDAEAERKHGSLAVREVFTNGRLWGMILLFFGVVFGAYGLGLWLPTIVDEMGDYSPFTIGVLVALPNLFAAAVMIPWERWARRRGSIPRQTGIALVVVAVSLLAAVVFRDLPAISLAWMCLGMGALFSSTPLFWSLPSAYLTGAAAAAGLAFINSVGNLAGFAGPYVMGWISDATGTPIWGLLIVSALILGGASVAFTLDGRENA